MTLYSLLYTLRRCFTIPLASGCAFPGPVSYHGPGYRSASLTTLLDRGPFGLFEDEIPAGEDGLYLARVQVRGQLRGELLLVQRL